LKLAGKRAEAKTKGPGTFRIQLFDEIANLTGADITNESQVLSWI
jgi:hydroxyethylthiazole kinase-like sugar kinase family protein